LSRLDCLPFQECFVEGCRDDVLVNHCADGFNAFSFRLSFFSFETKLVSEAFLFIYEFTFDRLPNRIRQSEFANNNIFDIYESSTNLLDRERDNVAEHTSLISVDILRRILPDLSAKYGFNLRKDNSLGILWPNLLMKKAHELINWVIPDCEAKINRKASISQNGELMKQDLGSSAISRELIKWPNDMEALGIDNMGLCPGRERSVHDGGLTWPHNDKYSTP